MSWLRACNCPGSSLVDTCGSWMRALATLAATSLLYVPMLGWLGWGRVLLYGGKGQEERSHWDMAYFAMQTRFPATEGRCLEVWHCVRGRSETELEQFYSLSKKTRNGCLTRKLALGLQLLLWLIFFFKGSQFPSAFGWKISFCDESKRLFCFRCSWVSFTCTKPAHVAADHQLRCGVRGMKGSKCSFLCVNKDNFRTTLIFYIESLNVQLLQLPCSWCKKRKDDDVALCSSFPKHRKALWHGIFPLSCSWATHSSSGWDGETSIVHHHVWWDCADLMIKKLILMDLLSPFVLWIGRALLVQVGPKVWLGVFLVVLQVDEGWIRRSVLCGFKGVKRRCVMTSLTINTMNPVGEEDSYSSLGELLLLSQRFRSLVEISCSPEDFLFIFEGVSHHICTFPLHPLPQVIRSALGLPK